MLGKINTYMKKLSHFAIILALLVFPFSVSAASLQDQINNLNAEIAKNQAALEGISHSANTLQGKVDALNAEIANLQNQIDLANLQIQQANQQIEEFKAKLDKQKRIMYENARVLYKQGNTSTIEILASSDNFSEFVNRQEYLETVKENVNRAAREVIALKDELEKKVEELKSYIAGQELQKTIVDSKRSEQATLLAQTRGEEAKYQELVATLVAQKNQAEEQLLAQLRAGSISGGNGAGAAVSAGQTVSAGQLVGYVGDSGFSFGAHLHFALIQNGNYANPQSYLNSGVTWPVPGYTTVTQPYGCVDNSFYSQGGCPPGYSFHRGMDIGAPYGAQAVATEGGKVTYAGCWAGSGFGNIVILDHGGGKQTYYPHLGSGCK